MKHNLRYLAVLVSTLFLQSCGGGGLSGGSKDTDTMVPTAGTIDISALPHPREDAVVITTDSHYIYDINKKPVLLRGVSLDYGSSPANRINGVPAIQKLGSNVVRIVIDENTTDTQLEGALAKAVDAGLISIVSFTNSTGKLSGSEDGTYMLEVVDTLWLKKWAAIISEDRFQGNIMINIADGWGPADIFNQDSLGYQGYIDTYKALIRKFRNIGFKVPLVIDAPSNGQDFNAFLNGRSRELMAADTQKNLIFGVHIEGPKWNTSDKISNAATLLYNEKVPFIATGIAGSGLAGEGEAAVDHLDVMNKAAGDPALSLSLPWVTSGDGVGYAVNLANALDLRGGAVISTQVFLDKLYAEFEPNNSGNYVQKGKLKFAMYLKDVNGNTLRAGSTTAADLRSNQWSKLSYSLPRSKDDINSANYMNGATSFDLSKVKSVGLQVSANGKSETLKADIKFDDLNILPGVPPVFVGGFDSSTEGWIPDWTNPVIGQQNGSLTIVPTSDQIATNLIIANNTAFQAVRFDRPLEITYRVFLPASYAGQGLWGNIYGKFGDGWSWVSNSFPTSQLKAGEWADVKTTIDFRSVGAGNINNPKAFGLQIGGYSLPKTEPILVDSISISDPSAKPTKTVTATQYKATFTKGAEGFVNAGWGGSATTSAADGVLNVTFPAGDGGAINKADINSISEIDFSGGIIVKMKVFIPANWSTANTLWMSFFFQDGNWNHFPYSGDLGLSNFKPGEWTELSFTVNNFPGNFSRSLKPQMFGFQYANVPAGTIKFDDIEIIGNSQVDDSQPIFTMDFSSQSQIDAVKFDFGVGAFTSSSLVNAKSSEWRVIPFGWTATSWKGNTGARAVLDINKAEDVVNLTQRGEAFVNGTYGIKATSKAAAVK